MGRSALRIRIGAELIAVLLVLASLGFAWFLVVAMYRQGRVAARAAEQVAVTRKPPIAPAPPAPEPAQAEAAPAAIAEPPVDPTPAALAQLAAEEESLRSRAAAADERAAAIESAVGTAEERTAAIKRRELVVRNQIATIEAGVEQLEGDLDQMARQRDMLARERDDARLELATARSRDGLSVLPYKGPSGTWRRPIPIECTNGTATIQPGGPTFGLLELTMAARFRSSPLIAALEQYVQHVEAGPSPDGGPVTPYIMFVIRPDGIRPYYEARAALEPLGIAFGYELVDQDESIEYPDLDDVAEWSETAPLKFARRLSHAGLASAGNANGSGSGNGSGSEDDPANHPWPNLPPGGGVGGGGATPASAGSLAVADGFVPADPEGGVASRGTPFPRQGGRSESFKPSGIGIGSGGGTGEAPRWGDLGALPGRGESGWPSTHMPRVVPDGSRLGPAMRGSGLAGNSRAGTGSRPPGAATRNIDGIASGMPGVDPRSFASGLSGTLSGSTPGGGGQSSHSALGDRMADTARALGLQGSGAQGGGGIGFGPQAPGLALAGDGDESNAGGGAATARPPGGIPFRPERPIELVVVCEPKGVLLQPGGYRLGLDKLEPGSIDLPNSLKAIVRRKEAREPGVDFKPKLTYLVKPGADDTYWKARRQTVLVGLGWPARLQIAEGDPPRLAVEGIRP